MEELDKSNLIVCSIAIVIYLSVCHSPIRCTHSFHFFQKIGDFYRGWVETEVELDLLLTYHKQQTASMWGTRQSPSAGKPSTRLMWKSQYVPFDGIPFVNAGVWSFFFFEYYIAALWMASNYTRTPNAVKRMSTIMIYVRSKCVMKQIANWWSELQIEVKKWTIRNWLQLQPLLYGDKVLENTLINRACSSI